MSDFVIVRDVVPWQLWLALAVMLAIAGHLALRRVPRRYPALGTFVLGILVGLLLATSFVRAGTPRPAALLAIPADPTAGAAAPEGHRVASSGTDAGRRTPAPRQSAPESRPLEGRASWYSVDGDVAAAGPALRRGHWRGSLVAVCAEACVTVRLVDFCQCFRGTAHERVIDLSPSAFARLAPLSAGLIGVTVRRVALMPPATDTDVPRGTR